MLNRKESKVGNGADNHGRGPSRTPASKSRPLRRRFIISSKAAGRHPARQPEAGNGTAKSHPPAHGKHPAGPQAANPQAPPAGPVDLAETIKTLLHLAHENGHITYDD